MQYLSLIFRCYVFACFQNAAKYIQSFMQKKERKRKDLLWRSGPLACPKLFAIEGTTLTFQKNGLCRPSWMSILVFNCSFDLDLVHKHAAKTSGMRICPSVQQLTTLSQLSIDLRSYVWLDLRLVSHLVEVIAMKLCIDPCRALRKPKEITDMVSQKKLLIW